MIELPALDLPRVLLPGGRIDVRLDADLWAGPLGEGDIAGVAAFYRPTSEDEWPRVGTLAAIVGRRLEGPVMHVRLRGLQRLVAPVAPAGPAARVAVEVDRPETVGGEVRARAEHLQRLLRSYNAALAEYGERAEVMIELPLDPGEAAYRVASLLRISAPERHFLLEAESTQERVERVAAVLRRETDLLRRTMGPRGA